MFNLQTTAAALLLAAIGGSVGALVIVWLLGAGVSFATAAFFVTWVLTFAGWFASARLSERAQRRMFRHNLLNDARAEIVKAIRAAQDWTSGITSFALTIQRAWEMRPQHPKRESLEERVYWSEVSRRGHVALFPDREAPAAELVIVLEEYEALFPQTSHVRMQLGAYSTDKIVTALSPLLERLLGSDNASAEKTIIEIEKLFEFSSEYSSVLEDLRIWIQNAVFSELTDHRVPERTPPDPTKVAITRERADGKLEIAHDGVPWPLKELPSVSTETIELTTQHRREGR